MLLLLMVYSNYENIYFIPSEKLLKEQIDLFALHLKHMLTLIGNLIEG